MAISFVIGAKLYAVYYFKVLYLRHLWGAYAPWESKRQTSRICNMIKLFKRYYFTEVLYLVRRINLIAFLYMVCFQAACAQLNPGASADSLARQSQLSNRKFIQLYKENAALSYTSPKGEIGAPSKYLINGKLTTTYMLLASSKMPVSFAVVPDFTVRVRDERSSGVRTPSFRLGGVLFVRLNQSPEHYKYASLAFTHHSNGQDNAAINPDGTINTRDGNFATNYLTASYHFGHRHPAKSGVYYTLNHDAGLEWHKWFSYEKALEGNYGFTRIIYNFSLRRYEEEKENWRLNMGLNYAVNSIYADDFSAIKKRMNIESSFNYSFPFMNNVFISVAAGYYGEDPYNIYFNDKYGYLRFGISSGFLRNKRQ